MVRRKGSVERREKGGSGQWWVTAYFMVCRPKMSMHMHRYVHMYMHVCTHDCTYGLILVHTYRNECTAQWGKPA